MSSLKKMEEKQARDRQKKKAEKMQLKTFLSAGGVGALEALAEKQGIAFVSGPSFKYLQAAAVLLARKPGKLREPMEAMGMIGIYKIAKEMTADFDLGGIFGG